MLNNKHSSLYGYLAWLLMVSYSQHISYNPLLVLFSPLGLIPAHYLFVNDTLKLPLGPLFGVFALAGAMIVGISVLAWHSRKDWVHISYWIVTISFAEILVLVDRNVNRGQSSFTASLIASWTPGFSFEVTLLFFELCLLGLVASSLYLFRRSQIGRSRLITFLCSCSMAAWLIWHMRVPRLEFRKDFSEGLAPVSIYGQWGYVDKSLRVVIPPRFSHAWAFTDGVARVQIFWSESGYIDKTGKVVLQMPAEGGGAFWEGLAPVSVNSRYGFMNKSGAMVIPPTFEGVRRFSEGLAAVLINSKYGYIDKTGRIVIPPEFESGKEFSEGLAPVLTGGRWGFIDQEGQRIVSFQFRNASGFHEGLAAVSIDLVEGGTANTKFGYIDRTGKFVIAARFEEAEDFSGQVAKVLLNGRYVTIDKRGNPADR